MRTKYLINSLHYWSEYPVDIIVIDGSKEPSLSGETLSLFAGIQYFHLPVSVEKRLSFAASKVKSKYSILCADDDFLSYASLAEAANILACNADVSAVLGETLGFVKLGKEVLFKSHYMDARSLNISSTDPKERYAQRTNASDSVIFYSLVRIETLILVCNLIAEYEYDCPYVTELQVEAFFCAAGKVVVIPQVMLFRNFGVPAISSIKYNRNVSFLDWVRHPKNLQDIEKLKEYTSKYFAKATLSQNPLTGTQFIELNIKKNVQELLPKQNYLISNFRKLYFLSPVLFKRLIRAVLIGFFGKTPSRLQSISKMYAELDLCKVQYNKNEIELIKRLTLDL